MCAAKITSDWTKHPDLLRIYDALAGFQVFVVGGCVRNHLLGKPITDIDLCTDAPPQQVLECLRKANIKAIPTGIDYGTITAVLGDPYEITTFRRDVQTDGRRAVVSFAATIEEDSLRRDFTVNALYLDADGNIYDPQRGLKDISPLRLRFIGDADQRIAEDYLRILRFFRFFAQYGDPNDGLDAEGLAACAQGADGLMGISRERIGAEMMKILSAPNAGRALASMVQCGVMRGVMPGADANSVAVLQHIEAVPADAIRRLAALGEFDAGAMLKLSKKQQTQYRQIRSAALSDDTAQALGYKLGAKLAMDALLVRSALMGQMLPAGVQNDIDYGAKQVFPLTSSDFQPYFSGPALGNALKVAKSYWITGGFSPSKAELIDQVKAMQNV